MKKNPDRLLLSVTAVIAVYATATGSQRALAQATDGRVEKRAVALTWTAPPECPGEEWVRAEIERLIGRPLVAGDSAAITATATVEKREDGGWTLRLRTEQAGSEGLRELQSAECGSLAGAAALILALSIDPRAVEERRAAEIGVESGNTPSASPGAREAPAVDEEARRPEPDTKSEMETPETEPEARTEPEGKIEPEDETEPEAGPPEAAQTAARFAFRLDALGDAGALPGVGAGMGAAAALLLGRLRLEVSLGYWPARQEWVEQIAPLGGELALLAATAGSCYRAWGEVLSLAPCAHLELGSMYGQGVNVTRSLEDSALWIALLAGARAGWRVTPWGALVLELGLAAPLLRPGYTLRVQGVPDPALVHRPASVAPRLRAGIELQL